MEEAKEAYAQMMRAYPDMTAPKFRQAMVFAPATLERMVANLKNIIAGDQPRRALYPQPANEDNSKTPGTGPKPA